VKNFTSFKRQGQLLVQITNTGGLAAAFICDFSCDSQILPIPTQKLYLAQNNSTTTLQIPIETKKNENTTYYCKLTLKNNIGDILDTYHLNFSSFAFQVILDYWKYFLTSQKHESEQNNDLTSNATNLTTIQASSKEETCENECNGIFAFWCNLQHVIIILLEFLLREIRNVGNLLL